MTHKHRRPLGNRVVLSVACLLWAVQAEDKMLAHDAVFCSRTSRPRARKNWCCCVQ